MSILLNHGLCGGHVTTDRTLVSHVGCWRRGVTSVVVVVVLVVDDGLEDGEPLLDGLLQGVYLGGDRSQNLNIEGK